MQKDCKIYWAIPSFTGMHHTLVVDSMYRAEFTFRSKYPHVHLRRDYCHRGFIDRVRNAALDRALAWGADYMLWWDDDIVAPDDALIRLYEEDKDVIAGMAFGRTEPFAMCSYKTDREDYLDLDGYDNLLSKDAYQGVKECDATGTGLMLMKMDVLQKVDRPFFRWPLEKAEDVEFCARLRHAGVKIHIHTDIELGHLRFQPQVVTKSDHDQFCNNLKTKLKRNPDIKKKLEKDLAPFQRLIDGLN